MSGRTLFACLVVVIAAAAIIDGPSTVTPKHREAVRAKDVNLLRLTISATNCRIKNSSYEDTRIETSGQIDTKLIEKAVKDVGATVLQVEKIYHGSSMISFDLSKLRGSKIERGQLRICLEKGNRIHIVNCRIDFGKANYEEIIMVLRKGQIQNIEMLPEGKIKGAKTLYRRGHQSAQSTQPVARKRRLFITRYKLNTQICTISE